MEKSASRRSQIEAFLREKKTGPITELPNRITTNIDLCETGRQIVELLEKTDREIIDGWLLDTNDNDALVTSTQGLKHDLVILDKLARLANLISSRLVAAAASDNPQKPLKIVLSGCGTSGRIAYLCSRTFNAYLGRESENVCEYTIAGGDWALVNSVESVEDKPEIGESELTKLIEENPNAEFVYIGITCGLSAPYVAGQLSYCMDEIEKKSSRVLACALIGFNPVEMARRTQTINKHRHETFADLLERMSSLEKSDPERYYILNPLIGPEPVTGSSRMKSGTATKIMLDIVLSHAATGLIVKDGQSSGVSVQKIGEMIDWYGRVMSQVVYSNADSIGNIIDRAAVSLRTPGASINYLTDDERLGFLACVDASECVPTYGANKNDIKGFVASADGETLTSLRGSNSWLGFIRTCHTVQSKNVIEKLDEFNSPATLFIVIQDDDNRDETSEAQVNDFPTSEKIVANLSQSTKAQICRIRLAAENSKNLQLSSSDVGLEFKKAGRDINDYFAQCLQEFALKLVLNAISTGAHVLIGKTYENIMIDVRVSNVKLFYRALGILKRLSGRSEQECEQCLFKSIYGEDGLLESIQSADVSQHIESATGQTLVVPRALVMLFTGCSSAEARDILTQTNNSVRNCIYKLKNSS